ncbi:hypothetical protein [Thioalkalivibrio sp. ALgr3]|uniref:hypothetical protein n=1 Tax=Thioalkalivibrio sp. ALgr3 TaxID=1239292 RepID=UPI00037484B3|nr:hypothetical protein [Thioalkalivibrio sp. ALgr3]
MHQSLDLYREELDLRREWPPRWRLLLLFAVSLLLGLFLWTVEYRAAQERADALAAAQAEQQAAEERLMELRGLRDTPEVRSAQAAAERAELRREQLAEAEALLQARLDQARASAPAEPLTGLARAATRPEATNIWIERMHIDGDTGELAIEGRALRADDLPPYLEVLGETGAHEGEPEFELHGGEDTLRFVFRPGRTPR